METLGIDKIKWWIQMIGSARIPQPLCPIHDLRLNPIRPYSKFIDEATSLRCEDCSNPYYIPRSWVREKQYVLDRIDAKVFKDMRVLNLDDEAIPLAEAKVKTKDEKFFVVANLNESKTGKRLVVYAGEKGKRNKTQIFVEPEIKRVSFDQRDLHPMDIFTKLEATFPDETKGVIKRGGEN